MTNIIDGRQVAKDLNDQLAQEVAELKTKGIHPKLVVVSVGEDPASKVYIRQKENAAKRVGMDFERKEFDSTITNEELLAVIEDLNQDDAVSGLIVQLPLPAGLDETLVTEAIDPKKDVDGFHAVNLGHLVNNTADLLPCTPRGIVYLLDHYGVDLRGQNVVVVGRSHIVGLPLAILLINRQATVTVANSRTKDMDAILQEADIVIAAVGVAELIKGAQLKEGVVVIDVGINRTADGQLVGDVEFDTAKEKAAWITPVPGGVGPMTVAMLMQQTVLAAKLNQA